MTATGQEIDLKVLRNRAEQAIRTSRPRDQIVRLLEEIVSRAEENSEASHFAHRHLAELRLEESPWTAALHLRRVLGASPEDDTAHALMGLCQALQGNFRMAVSAYRKALSIAPANPWYNHNLGHLLDVALGTPSEALGYLRKAHRYQPDQEEVGASLAHCLGRLGQCAEALLLTRTLLRLHPRHEDLRSLQKWLEQGAPPKATGPHVRGRAAAPVVSSLSPRPSRPPPVPLEMSLAECLRRAGATDVEIGRATRIWDDFSASTRAVMCAVTAAAIDYALSRIDGARATQRDVAERHGVSARELAGRFRDIKSALGIVPRDARYT